MAKPIFGICHICGEHKKLSFEHVPPKAAFNDSPILRSSFERIAMGENLDDLGGSVQQRGSGAHTLCEKCNSDTGAWYAGADAKWAEQAMRLKAERNRPADGRGIRSKSRFDCHAPHQFRTRNYCNERQRTHSNPTKNARKSTAATSILPLITVWFLVRVQAGPPRNQSLSGRSFHQ